jgi:hypothetical protein
VRPVNIPRTVIGVLAAVAMLLGWIWDAVGDVPTGLAIASGVGAAIVLVLAVQEIVGRGGRRR